MTFLSSSASTLGGCTPRRPVGLGAGRVTRVQISCWGLRNLLRARISKSQARLRSGSARQYNKCIYPPRRKCHPRKVSTSSSVYIYCRRVMEYNKKRSQKRVSLLSSVMAQRSLPNARSYPVPTSPSPRPPLYASP